MLYFIPGVLIQRVMVSFITLEDDNRTFHTSDEL